MTDRSHLSIGEVLSLLREEFPDVTISKIRFLESQGLVDPERTPSGYRKFYEHDVERLRWILRQQRENFLPLKIIRGRLSEHGEDIDEDDPDDEPGPADRQDGDVAPTQADPDPVPSAGSQARQTIEAAAVSHPSAAARQPSSPARGAAPSASTSQTSGSGLSRSGPASPPTPSAEPPASSTGAAPVAARPGRSGPAGSPPEPAETPARLPGVASPERATAGRSAAASGASGRARGQAPVAGPAAYRDDTETYSVEELASASGGTVAMVAELQEFGLISSRTVVGGTLYFDAAALAVARAAAGFSRHGVEARHLRAWRNSADREAGLFEQVVMPLLRQRNPEARQQAAALLLELTSLGGDLRKALIDQAVRQIH